MIQGNDIEDPSNVPSSLNAGETFSWTTDGSVVREGWQLCFTPASDAPSSDYFTMTGSCDVRDDCVSSSNFPDVHGNDEACSITMQMDASVSVSDGFSLETCCDHLMIRGVDVESQDAVPRSLNAGETFSWSSDGSVTSPGWELCFSEMMSTPEPTMDESNYFSMSGDCDIQGDCVSSAGYPNVHGNNEQCTINILQDSSLTVGSTFNLETCCDHLMIGERDIESSDAVPSSMNAGDSFTWSTD
jgi:hypothetical protein